MKVEVEQKFWVEQLLQVEQMFADLGIRLGEVETQVDTYFAHPSRDFAQTDEALRIRRIGQDNFVTYKGPKLDKATKSRREIELPLASGEEGAVQFAALLAALGFRRVAEVRKNRRHASLPVEGWQIEAALDEVTGVGSFVELEAVVDEPQMEQAKEQLAVWVEKLALTASERRSYLELLLESQGKT